MKKIPVHEAIGTALCHDITRILPGREKTRAFARGHIITPDDIPLLQSLGKEYIYVWEDSEHLVHEDDAALRIASLCCGEGVSWDTPNQGKVTLTADYDGLLKVRTESLDQLNSIEGIILATLNSGRVVTQGTTVAGTRVIPLAIEKEKLEQAEKTCLGREPILSIRPFLPLKVGIITTGNEVFTGRVQDGFGAVLQEKTAPYQARLIRQVIVPDHSEAIEREIHQLVAEGAELIFVTGGMSVDPDDVTPAGIRRSGAEVVFYGVPVLPGSMLMLAYLQDVAICGTPGCVMFNGVTSLDLILPYLFAGERVSREQIVKYGHGGLCQECPDCRYPACGFGKSGG